MRTASNHAINTDGLSQRALYSSPNYTGYGELYTTAV